MFCHGNIKTYCNYFQIERADKCFNITQVKVAEVGNIKAAEINAFSYYSGNRNINYDTED